MTGYLRFRKIFENKTPEVREKFRQSKELGEDYQSYFTQKVNGYYFDRWRRRPITSKVNLPMIERKSIIKNLLNGRPPYEYYLAFPEDYFDTSP